MPSHFRIIERKVEAAGKIRLRSFDLELDWIGLD